MKDSKLLRKLIPFVFFTISMNAIIAQSISNIYFGTDSTLEIVTWNIEHFPKNGQTTMDSVAKVIKAINADIYAFQEIDDTLSFISMVNEIDGYEYYFKSTWYAGLAYIYKTKSIDIDSIYEIYTSSPYWNAFPRSPMVMEFGFDTLDYVLINNHFKCCGDGYLSYTNTKDEENRRYTASILLHDYIQENFEHKKLILVGDLNDVLTDLPENNVFKPFLKDSLNFLFADYAISIGSSTSWSYPSWPSHLDHILITNELFEDFGDENSEISVIKVDKYLKDGWSEYDNNLSDHRPVAIQLVPIPYIYTETDIDFRVNNNRKLRSSPNPCDTFVGFKFPISGKDMRLTIYSVFGKKIDALFIKKGQSEIEWKTKNISNGIYFVTLTEQTKLIAKTKIVIEH